MTAALPAQSPSSETTPSPNKAVDDKFGISITKGDCGSGFEHNDLDDQQLTLSTTIDHTALPIHLTVRGPTEAKSAQF